MKKVDVPQKKGRAFWISAFRVLFFFCFAFYSFIFASEAVVKPVLFAKGEEIGTDQTVLAWDLLGDDILLIDDGKVLSKIDLKAKRKVVFVPAGPGPEEVKEAIFLDVVGREVFVLGYRETKLKVFDANGKFLRAYGNIPPRVDYFQVYDGKALFIHTLAPPFIWRNKKPQRRYSLIDLEDSCKVLAQADVDLNQLSNFSNEIQMIEGFSLNVLNLSEENGRIFVYPFSGLSFMETFPFSELDKIETYPNFAIYPEYLAPAYDQFPRHLDLAGLDTIVAVRDFCVDAKGRHYIVSGISSLEAKPDGEFPEGKRITVTEDFNPIATWDLDIEVSNILYLPSRNALILRERNDGDLYEIKL